MTVDPRVLEKLFQPKQLHRKKLAALPFHEKLRILVTMQRRDDSIIRSRGGAGRMVWKLS